MQRRSMVVDDISRRDFSLKHKFCHVIPAVTKNNSRPRVSGHVGYRYEDDSKNISSSSRA